MLKYIWKALAGAGRGWLEEYYDRQSKMLLRKL
jgi:hypothetical protein